MPDTRIVYGFRCFWWDSIDKVGLSQPAPDGPAKGHRIPLCPHCGSPLMEVESLDRWFVPIDQYEADGHPGYRALIEWSRGKCFPSRAAAGAAYREATGKEAVV